MRSYGAIEDEGGKEEEENGLQRPRTPSPPLQEAVEGKKCRCMKVEYLILGLLQLTFNYDYFMIVATAYYYCVEIMGSSSQTDFLYGKSARLDLNFYVNHFSSSIQIDSNAWTTCYK